MKINKDFKIKKYSTDVKKLSFAHKTGNLYLERKINFKKKINSKRLFKKKHLIIFNGELIHGNGVNQSNKTRISIDLRFIEKKHLLKNPVQGSLKKKYFKYINL